MQYPHTIFRFILNFINLKLQIIYENRMFWTIVVAALLFQ